MKKKKRRNALKAFTVPLPEEMPISEIEREGMTHVLICPRCGTRRYTDGRLAEALADITVGMTEQGLSLESVGPRHRPCNVMMEMQKLGRDDD